MADIAHRETDKIIEELEQRLSKEYRQAYEEVRKKASAYFETFKVEDAKWKKLVAEGKKTEKEYRAWAKNEALKGKRWTELRDSLAADLASVNREAASIIRGRLADVVAINGNYAEYMIENGFRTNYGFTLYSREAIENLAANDPDIIPWKPDIDIPKDLRWNRQQITSHITQGILQGESIPNLANRLKQTVGNNQVAAVRTARTAVTSSENAGRQMVYDKAKAMGIKVKKEWLATLDGRTRDEHGAADGQQVEVDDYFSVGGEKMRYPGDMSASPWNVYNCRCTMITVEPPEIMQGEEPRTTWSEWIKSKSQTSEKTVRKKEYSQKQLEQMYDSVGAMWDLTPQERYYLASEFTSEIANPENFFENSVGFWEAKKSPPRREADYISYSRRTGKISSKYWYDETGVYRQSDHWGSDVASCSWYIDGRTYKSEGVIVGKKETAFIRWDDLKAKGMITKHFATGEYGLLGFKFEK